MTHVVDPPLSEIFEIFGLIVSAIYWNPKDEVSWFLLVLEDLSKAGLVLRIETRRTHSSMPKF